MPEEVTNVYAPAAESVELEPAKEFIQAAVKESKSGYRTTEFWLTILGSLAVVFNGVPAPESKEGYIVAGLLAVYAVARGLAKKGVPVVDEPTPVE
jgi:hypothetical protein